MEPQKQSKEEQMNSLMSMAQYLQSQQQLLANQMQMLSSAMIRINYMIETVDAYGNKGITHVNIGNNIFMPVKLIDDMGMIIELGSGYFAYVQKSYAIEYLNNRKAKLEHNMEKANGLSESISQKLAELNKQTIALSGQK